MNIFDPPSLSKSNPSFFRYQTKSFQVSFIRLETSQKRNAYGHTATHPDKRIELGVLFGAKKTKQLHADTRGDDQQDHGEENEIAQLFSRAQNLLQKVLEQRGRLDEADYPQHLEIGQLRVVKLWQQAQSCTNRQNEFELHHQALEVAVESERVHFEKNLHVKEQREKDFNVSVELQVLFVFDLFVCGGKILMGHGN